MIKVEHFKLPSNTFCTGAAFVAKRGGVDEDDGWIIAYVHNEDRNTSHVTSYNRISLDYVLVMKFLVNLVTFFL